MDAPARQPPSTDMSDAIRMAVFLLILFVVYLAAVILVVDHILRRFRGRPRSSRPFLWLRRAVYALAILGGLCIAYGYYIAPSRLEVTHVPIVSAELSGETRPIRIVQISDVHSDARPRLEPRLPGVIAAQHPDLIVFTGDSINTPAGLPIFKKLMTRLAAIAPTYAVRGNWDVQRWWNIDLFGSTGVHEMEGDAVEIHLAGVTLCLAGAPDGDSEAIERALKAIPPHQFSVFLYHSPDQIAQIAESKVDLCLVGDTHGGQVDVPFYGAIITGSIYGRKYVSGLYRYGRTLMYVNRGIGMTGDNFPVRFDATPEVTVFELKAPPAR